MHKIKQTLNDIWHWFLKLISRIYHWLTAIPYEEGWNDGVSVGFSMAEQIAHKEGINAERRRINKILVAERDRLLTLEQVNWKGYSQEVIYEVETLMSLVGKPEKIPGDGTK